MMTITKWVSSESLVSGFFLVVGRLFGLEFGESGSVMSGRVSGRIGLMLTEELQTNSVREGAANSPPFDV
jgi:hypothetical protein